MTQPSYSSVFMQEKKHTCNTYANIYSRLICNSLNLESTPKRSSAGEQINK